MEDALARTSPWPLAGDYDDVDERKNGDRSCSEKRPNEYVVGARLDAQTRLRLIR